MFTLLLAAALAFTDTDAELAYSLTGKFVESCTPRVAGTIRGRAASFWILDNASSVGANVRRDQFVAKTSNTPSGISKIETSNVPPPRS